MILTKEQINRHMRHIIMPEIGGKGQKKLLNTTVFAYGESVSQLSSLLYYLAATGISRIYCYFEDSDGYENLFDSIKDFNNDISIKLVDGQSLLSDGYGLDEITEFACSVILGSPELVKKVKDHIMSLPSVVALSSGWKGILQTFDSDKVEISNLNRQILHTVSRLGMAKVDSAEVFLKNINPYVNINKYNISLNEDNVMELVRDYDMVISAVDNIPACLLMNDACHFSNKPLIESGVLRFNGMNTTLVSGEGHCYRCIYPETPRGGLTCAETGILGPVPGVMGFIEAAEAIKLIIGHGNILKNKLLMYDALNSEFSVISIEKTRIAPCAELTRSSIRLSKRIWNVKPAAVINNY